MRAVLYMREKLNAFGDEDEQFVHFYCRWELQ